MLPSHTDVSLPSSLSESNGKEPHRSTPPQDKAPDSLGKCGTLAVAHCVHSQITTRDTAALVHVHSVPDPSRGHSGGSERERGCTKHEKEPATSRPSLLQTTDHEFPGGGGGAKRVGKAFNCIRLKFAVRLN